MPKLRSGLFARIILFLLCLLITSCAGTKPASLIDPAINQVWPPPPNQPRIKYLREIKGPNEIFADKGKVSHFFDMLTGEKMLSLDFSTPYGITSDGESKIYVADNTAGVVHCLDLQRREVSYIGQAGDAYLAGPIGVALDKQGNLYVSDSETAKVYKFNKNGEYLKEIKGQQEFKRPAGIAIDGKGTKYVVDALAHKLYLFNENDNFIGDFPKIKEGEELNSPSNVALDKSGNVYVTDSMNFMVRVYDHEGNLLRNIGGIGDAPGSFARPKGVAVDSDGHIYVVDATHDNYQIFDQAGRLLLYIGTHGRGIGEFYLPSGIFIDSKDRIFVTDTYNHRIQVFQYIKEGASK